MAKTSRRKNLTLSPADPAAALAAEMAAVVTVFDVQEIGQNQARWDRLVALCEADWRADNPASFPPARVRGAVAERFDGKLPEALKADAVKLDDWNNALLNIYADAGFRLGLAMGRGR